MNGALTGKITSPSGAGGSRSVDLSGQRPSGAGHHLAVQQAGLQQFADDHLNPADPVDVEHGIGAVGPGVGQHRHHVAGQGIELVRRHHVPPEVPVAGGAGDLGGMQHRVGRAADGHGDDDRVADRVALDDVPGAEPGRHHVRQMLDQLGRKFVQPARIVGRRGDHVQGLQAHDADEGLHGVVGEHAAAAADAGAGVAGDLVPVFGVRMPGGLVGADDVEGLAGLRVPAGPDGAVGHDDRRLVVFENGGERAHRRLVAGDHGDGAGEPGGLQVLAEGIVGDLAADQRIAHLGRAVADAVGRGDGVFGLDEPVLQFPLAAADPAEQAVVDRPDLGLDADVALAVALGPDDADRGFVNQGGVRAELVGETDGLRRAPGMAVDQDGIGFRHGNFPGYKTRRGAVAGRARPAAGPLSSIPRQPPNPVMNPALKPAMNPAGWRGDKTVSRHYPSWNIFPTKISNPVRSLGLQ